MLGFVVRLLKEDSERRQKHTQVFSSNIVTLGNELIAPFHWFPPHSSSPYIWWISSLLPKRAQCTSTHKSPANKQNKYILLARLCCVNTAWITSVRQRTWVSAGKCPSTALVKFSAVAALSQSPTGIIQWPSLKAVQQHIGRPDTHSALAATVHH